MLITAAQQCLFSPGQLVPVIDTVETSMAKSKGTYSSPFRRSMPHVTALQQQQQQQQPPLSGFLAQVAFTIMAQQRRPRLGLSIADSAGVAARTAEEHLPGVDQAEIERYAAAGFAASYHRVRCPRSGAWATAVTLTALPGATIADDRDNSDNTDAEEEAPPPTEPPTEPRKRRRCRGCDRLIGPGCATPRRIDGGLAASWGWCVDCPPPRRPPPAEPKPEPRRERSRSRG